MLEGSESQRADSFEIQLAVLPSSSFSQLKTYETNMKTLTPYIAIALQIRTRDALELTEERERERETRSTIQSIYIVFNKIEKFHGVGEFSGGCPLKMISFYDHGNDFNQSRVSS